MRRLVAALGCFALCLPQAHAEIEKLATICDNGICFHWWPKLPAVNGWHQDEKGSIHYSFNAQAPDGETFVSAEAVIYANAPYKPRMPAVQDVQALIDDDHARFRKDFPGMVIREVEPLFTADGQKLRSFTYSPAAAGSWERVSYGEEGEFFLIFAASSRSQQGLEASMGAYRQFINSYKTRP